MYYAQTLIEHNGLIRPGQVVPDDLPGLEELVAAGSVSTEPWTRTITVDAQNREIGAAHVEAFAGDFTTEEILDPEVDTPSLGIPGDPAQVEHAANHDAGSADA